ncbi:MAG: hypothetical protein JWQ40_3304 [Segetibacter sp.]|nr:hypothetical protein [Segetibacter sp.]
MFELLFRYLILHNKVALPGIGVFFFTRQPAAYNFNDKVFISPGLQIAFSAEATAADKRFYTFISREQNVEEWEAVKQVNDLAYDLKYNLNINRSVLLPGLGSLSYNQEGVVEFTSSQHIQSYFPTVDAERVGQPAVQNAVTDVAPASTHTEAPAVSADEEVAAKRKNYWWIVAIILALIGIAAIVYYYINNGSLGSTF